MKIVTDLSLTSAPHRVRHGWHPGWLFRSGAQGAWFDPSDLSTLFQDVAGTIPITADGQPVAMMLDSSGNNNHAVQSIVAARPTWRTDGTHAWLEHDGVDDRLLISPIPYPSSTFGLCIGLQYQSGGGVWASWRSRDIIDKYVGLAHPTAGGAVTDAGGILRLNAYPAPTSRVPLWNAQLARSVGSATGITTAAFAGRHWQFLGYANTVPPAGRFYGYVESETLDAASVVRAERWMASKTGVEL